MPTYPTARLRLDAKRRPTIPTALLDAAGVGADQELIARVDGPGRIVLESDSAVLAELQAAVAAACHIGAGPSLVDDLFAERAAEVAREERSPDSRRGEPAAGSPAAPAGTS